MVRLTTDSASATTDATWQWNDVVKVLIGNNHQTRIHSRMKLNKDIFKHKKTQWNNSWYNTQQRGNHQVSKWVEDLNRHLTREDTQMEYGHMKRYSTPHAIRELQVKIKPPWETTVHLLKWLKPQNLINTNCWQGYRATGTLMCYW